MAVEIFEMLRKPKWLFDKVNVKHDQAIYLFIYMNGELKQVKGSGTSIVVSFFHSARVNSKGNGLQQ